MIFLILALSVYSVTLIITSSHILECVRERIKLWFPYLRAGGKHFIECRMCVGFWVSLVIYVLFLLDLFLVISFFAIYGCAYIFSLIESYLLSTHNTTKQTKTSKNK